MNETRFKAYRGNPNLKRENQSIEWTQELLEEYIKCASDVVYFAEKYMKIIHVDRGLIPYVMYDYQKEIANKIVNNRYNITCCARQSGKTTTVVAVVLWYVLFNSEKTVALLANKGETAREILGRVRLAYQHLPKWLQHGVREWNKGSVEFENNSRIIAAATSSDTIRGYSISLLYIDECAFVENFDEFFASVAPTIVSGTQTKVVLVSTPNGMNHFYDLWVNANKPEDQNNGYVPTLVTWQDVPGRDEEWRINTLKTINYDQEKFDQEYNCEFHGSTNTLIAGWKLKELMHRYQQPKVSINGLSQYELAEKDHSYVCVVDVSRGKGLDYSAFHIIDVSTMPYKQSCTFRSNTITPIDYVDIIMHACKIYNDAYVLVEVNDVGEQVATSLAFDYSYDNILYTKNTGRLGKSISQGFSPSIDRGVRTTKVVKAIGCSTLKLLIEQNQLEIYDKETVIELGTFSKKNKSYEAEEGKHDDLVMGLVLFAWLSDQQFFKDHTNINTLMQLRDKTDEEIMADLMPFGFVDDGRNGLPVEDIVPVTTYDRHTLDEFTIL